MDRQPSQAQSGDWFPIFQIERWHTYLYSKDIRQTILPLPYRLDKAKEAAGGEVLLWDGSGAKGVVEAIRELTHGRGADVCVDAVGFEPDRNFADKAKAVGNLEKGSPKPVEIGCRSAKRPDHRDRKLYLPIL